MIVRIAMAVFLVAASFTTAVQVVMHRHEARVLFVILQDLHEQQNKLDREWGQLLLEQSTWATHGRIESIAREKLDMKLPEPQKTLRVRS